MFLFKNGIVSLQIGIQALFGNAGSGSASTGSASARNNVPDPDPRSGAFLNPGSGIRADKKSGFGSGIRKNNPADKHSGFKSGIRIRKNNPDHISESLETIFLG
jgi:hypothetical protein